jgi:hypothetical protein
MPKAGDRPTVPPPIPGVVQVRWSRLAGALLVVGLAASCGGEAEPAGGVGGEAAVTWRRIDGGWARAVALEPSFVMEGARAGDTLEAVVLPSGPGRLVVESRRGGERIEERIDVTGATRVAIPLARGGRASVRFEGAAALLHAPRLVHRRDEEASGGKLETAPRRILLVVIDTLRADAVTAETMPELLASFEQGTLYARAYSAATWTLPSMAALLTGKPPTALALPDGTLIALGAGEATLAGDLAARGFHTVGISANYTVNHDNGFSSGFEVFLAPAVLDHGDWPDAEWVLDRARRALEWFPDRDLFLYLHLMDPHDPYVDRATGGSVAAPATGTPADHDAVARMRAAYASEARHVSTLLAAFLREAGPFERVVVTADHGEEFLEHGGFRHGPTVYPEVSRVPLLVRGAGVPAGAVDAPVSLTSLRRFLGADRPGELLQSGDDVDIVSFVHAAPRFSWAHQAGQAVLFARDLDQRPAKPTGLDPIGEWLRARHPALDFVDPQGAPRAPLDGEASDAALRLARRFHRLRAGRWILVPAGVERVRVELDGVQSGGWWWGAAKAVTLTGPAQPNGVGAPRSAALEIEAPDPFVLVFVPTAEGAVGLGGAEGALAEIDGPPPAWPAQGAVTWRDPGRPAAALEGVEETMRRLRAQGYL